MNKFWLIFVLIVVAFGACKEEGDLGSITIGDDFVSSQTSIAVVDTYSVRMSTVIEDSIPTLRKGVLFAGQYQDEYFGQMSSHAYMELTIPETFSLDDDDVLDSLTLKLKYSEFVFGDTLIPQTFELFRITEWMEEYDDGQIYNTTSFKYDETPLGSITLKPRPGRDNYLEIRLPDTLGNEFLAKKRAGDNDITSESKFIEYFNGLVLKSTTNNGAILSFDAQDTTIGMVLYTHRVEAEKIESSFRFNLNTDGIYYNKIVGDRSSTFISQLTTRKEELPSSQTGKKAFMQAGVGIFTRLDFPSLTSLLEKDRKFVLAKAELILRPVRGSYDDINLPSELVLYNSDKYNSLVSEIQSSDGSILAADLYVDEIYKENTYYKFDVTSYISSELVDANFDVNHGLLVGLTGTSIGGSMERVVFDGSYNRDYRSMLKLYYIFYN